jgi:PAS domain S-box-containing protein
MDATTSARAILDSIQDFAVIASDAQGIITFWNPGAERLFGFSAQEAVGQDVALIFTPEDREAGEHRRETETARAEGCAVNERWHIRKNGERFFASGMVRPILANTGHVQGFTKVCRDITQRKRLMEALEEADRRKNEFIAMLGHELRNPLAAIQNAVQLSKGEDGAEHAAWSQRVIERQAKQISRLLEDLLDVSRSRLGMMQLQKEAIDVRAIIQRAVDAVRPLIETRQHELAISTAPGPLQVLADPGRIEQVLVNLLANAIKYTEPGGVITLRARAEDSHVVLEVEDNGMGIAPEAMPHIFDLFAQSSAARERSQGGLGLGLTLVKRIVEMHGGAVLAQSDGPGKGSRFTVRLPTGAASAAETLAASPAAPVPARQAPARILVIDDNVDSASGLAKLLKARKHEVETAADGETGVELARGFEPHVVLLDLNLPDGDGCAVARELRATESGRKALLVAVTGYGSDEDRQRVQAAGFDHYLLKPVDVETILHLTEKAPR